jgi:hypothetical protein
MFHPRRLLKKSSRRFTEDEMNRTSWEIRRSKKFFIMDDLGYDAPIWVKNKDIKFLFMNGRHIHTLTWYPKGIPALRTNVDYTFIFREHDEQENSL